MRGAVCGVSVRLALSRADAVAVLVRATSAPREAVGAGAMTGAGAWAHAATTAAVDITRSFFTKSPPHSDVSDPTCHETEMPPCCFGRPIAPAPLRHYST